MKRSHRRAILLFLSLLTALQFAACVNEQEPPRQTETAPAQTAASTSAITAENTDIPQLSIKGGFYNSPVQLTLTAQRGKIYYTTDGSNPTADSPLYEGAITLADCSAEPNTISMHAEPAPKEAMPPFSLPDSPVDKATVVKAITIDENGVPSAAAAETYFIGFDAKAQYYQEYPVISMIVDEVDLYDAASGIYTLGNVYHAWRGGAEYDPSLPDYAIPANYSQRGKEWERKAYIQYFENGQQMFAQNVGIRIHGGATRSFPQKSFNLYARSEYGASKLNYDVFSGALHAKSDGSAVTEFDTLMLRNGGNDAIYTRFRDKLNQSLVSDRQFVTQAMRPCILFVNGEFWGHYEITEKVDDDFLKTHYGVSKKDICIIKKDALEQGTDADFNGFEQLREWIRKTDFSVQSEYETLCSRVDIASLTDYLCCELYMNNANWGASNMAMWKTVKTDPANPYADGKWRFIMFDTDYSTGIYGQALVNEDNIAALLRTDCFLSDLFRGALENAEFRQQFTETFTEIAQKNFNAEHVSAEIDHLEKSYHDMVIDTYNRFWKDSVGGAEADTNYRAEVQIVRRFYETRYDYIMQDLKMHCS